ncbi:Putative Holliday junction resolvase [Candidatus Providencia siddallii]|uniref:Putative pre-16S rRNA nuclease n=1 Tax=Candidatus Providencia siddallii TaxID=1715285 RepID=A0A0M6W945_9GAMM|nr:Putative Holliday junction resolvase [Candidatus Providencia siddallii]
MLSDIFLAFDFGTKNIGVAVGQEITATANPLASLKTNSVLFWLQIENLFKEWYPKLVVVGLPFNMDGTEQFVTAKARIFANKINIRFNIKVELHDERLSTVEARSILFENKWYQCLNKRKIDSIAAAIILESWFKRTTKNNDNNIKYYY